MDSAQARKGEIHRHTKETDIQIAINIDGKGSYRIQTGVPFMDHMLTLLAVHGFFDLTITATGDTDIDDHHTVEDLGICLGQAIRSALGNFTALRRYGFSSVPMDETLVRVTLDLSNRPFLHFGVSIPGQKVGQFDTCLVEEFFRALTLNAGMTLHIEQPHGNNAHHIIEAIFKSFGKSLDMATAIEPRTDGAPLSSKGSLA